MTEGRRILVACLTLLAAASPAQAESLWELALPGEPMLALDAHSLALGGASDARWELESGLPDNPAQLMGLDGVTFATVIQIRRARREIGDELWDETRQDFPGFQVSASLPRGLRLGAGYRSSLRSRGSFHESKIVEDIDYDLNFSQEGGTRRFPLDLAFAVGERLRLGLGLTLYRGSLEQEWFYDFPNSPFADPDFQYQDRRVRRQAEWRGKALNLGIQAQPQDWIAASFSWEGAAELEGDEIVETAGEEGAGEASLDGESPARWALGLALRLAPGLVVSGQWNREAWADYASPVAVPELSDVDRFGLGLEWTREPEQPAHRRGQLFPLRLGFRLGNQPRPDPITGGEVRERLIAVGTGIDVQEGRGSLDLTLYWQSYNVDDGEGETRWGLALGLRTSEIWKRRTLPY